MQGFDAIRRAIRTDASLPEKLVRSTLAFIVPTVLRWLLDRGALGVPFALYFPAILMISVILGWRWAGYTTLGSGLCAYYLLIPRHTFEARPLDAAGVLGLFALSIGVMIAIGSGLRMALLELDRQAEALATYNEELQHRTRNIFQVVRALAGRAARGGDPARFQADLNSRLDALSQANELLKFGTLAACPILQLIRTSVAPFDRGQIALSGPDCPVEASGCTPLVMALHELATNASKYGALSSDAGRVTISWEIAPDHTIRILWTEKGGPPVTPPTRKGIGSRLLSPRGGMIAVSHEFPPDGVTCTLAVRLA